MSGPAVTLTVLMTSLLQNMFLTRSFEASFPTNLQSTRRCYIRGETVSATVRSASGVVML